MAADIINFNSYTLIRNNWATEQNVLDTIRNALIITFTPKIGKPITRAIYSTVQLPGTTEYYTVMPRFYGHAVARKLAQFGPKIIVGEPKIEPNSGGLPWDIRAPTLYNYQQVLTTYLLKNVFRPEFLNSGLSSTTIKLRTGAGKTFVAAGLIHALKTPTLYITINCLLQEQCIGDLNTIFGPKLTVAKSVRAAPAHVTVIVVNSIMIMDEETAEAYFKKFGLVIFDEIHALAGEKRSQIFWKVQSPYVLGMTATPGERMDLADIVYQKHFGPVLDVEKLPGFCYDNVNFTGRAIQLAYVGLPEFNEAIIDEKTGLLRAGAMIQKLSTDPARNNLVCEILDILSEDESRYIFVFAENRKHVSMLEHMYYHRHKAQNNMPAQQMLVGGATRGDLDNAAKKARIVFCTYSYGGTGTSLNSKMNTAVFVTSRRNKYRQVIGRILRASSNTADIAQMRLIIDFFDVMNPLQAQFRARAPIYAENGFPVVKVKAHHQKGLNVGAFRAALARPPKK